VADKWTLGRLAVYSLAAFITVTLVLAAPPMIDVYSRRQLGLKLTLLLVPQAIPLGIAVAVPLGIVCSMPRGRVRVSAGRIRGLLLVATVAGLIAFAAMLIVPVANQAFRVALAKKLDFRGTTYSLPRGMTEMSLSELASRISEYDAAGFPQAARKVARAYHIRFALPAATVVMSLLALAICGTLRGRAGRIVAAFIALALYWAILSTGDRNADLPAIGSVWAPNIVFTAMSLALLKTLPRQPDSAR
jgi:hypothetical protein